MSGGLNIKHCKTINGLRESLIFADVGKILMILISIMREYLRWIKWIAGSIEIGTRVYQYAINSDRWLSSKFEMSRQA